MSTVDIAALRDLLAEATPGPCDADASDIAAHMIALYNDRDDANAAIITAAVNALPALLDELEAARERIAELEVALLDELEAACAENVSLGKRNQELADANAKLREALESIRAQTWSGLIDGEETANCMQRIAGRALALKETP